MGKFDAVKSAELGMPVSTARSRLVKMLLFRELQRSGQNNCFKCTAKIDKIEELSIEHKMPWLHVSPELFWDLDNVEFSHSRCNTPDRPNRDNSAAMKAWRKNEDWSETVWCSKHQDYLPRDRFTNNKHHRTGKQDICRECRSKYRSP